MNQMSKLDAFIQQAVTAMPISGTSLIASLYGDALLQRGGEVWLGSVAALLEGLGFGERFVRTALFRLNKEEWLDVVRIGRRSFYRLSDKGLRLTRRAEHKIYRASAPEWDGTWLLLLSEGLEKNVLADVKKQLLWQGFGALAPSLLASPSQKLADIQSLLHEAGVADMRIHQQDPASRLFPFCTGKYRWHGSTEAYTGREVQDIPGVLAVFAERHKDSFGPYVRLMSVTLN